MIRRLAPICLVTASLVSAVPAPATAAITTRFATVDSVRIDPRGGGWELVVVGILVGDTARRAHVIAFAVTGENTNAESMLNRCERFATLAMSKPGKYVFGFGPGPVTLNSISCQLEAVTP